MLTPENIEVLNELILDHAKTSPTILGARLGDIVKRTFPNENIKSNYGSVAKFVNKHFSSILTLTGRHGVDNVYAFSPSILEGIDGMPISPAEHIVQPSNESNGPKLDKPFAMRKVVSEEASTEVLREAIIESIRIMTTEQLRQLPIPAGILLDAISKANRL